MSIPAELKFSKEHEWVRVEGDTVVIGITDFAQRELGDIVYVEIETQGKSLKAGEVFGSVEAVKTVSDLYLPLSGTVLEINPALNSPELVNTDPYGEGWMIRLKPDDLNELDELMDAAAYAEIAG